MKNILVTGAYGQLGNEVRILSANYPEYNFMFTDVDSLDICDKDELIDFVTGNDIRYIINCAAYTAVDKAEDEEEKARSINATAVSNLAYACKLSNTLLIHVSTDYVFDGTSERPYLENDIVSPNCVYGKTKAEGEQNIIKSTPEMYDEYIQNQEKLRKQFVCNS